jgi:hypothetical protein
MCIHVAAGQWSKLSASNESHYTLSLWIESTEIPSGVGCVGCVGYVGCVGCVGHRSSCAAFVLVRCPLHVSTELPSSVTDISVISAAPSRFPQTMERRCSNRPRPPSSKPLSFSTC